MWKYFDLRLLRKLLILCSMVAGVFILSADRRAAAMPCCFPCNTAYDECLAWCGGEDWKPQFYSYCVAAYCEPDYQTCGQFCEEQPGIFGCTHP